MGAPCSLQRSRCVAVTRLWSLQHSRSGALQKVRAEREVACPGGAARPQRLQPAPTAARPHPTAAPQYMHIPDSERCNWLRARIETAERQEYSQEEKLRILDRWAGPRPPLQPSSAAVAAAGAGRKLGRRMGPSPRQRPGTCSCTADKSRDRRRLHDVNKQAGGLRKEQGGVAALPAAAGWQERS